MRLPASSIVARRLSAWLLSAFVAFLAVPAYAQTEVPSNWPLKPPGLNVGDEFRLLFMGKNSRNADSTDIAVYDLYVQGRIADIGHADIKAYASHFKVLGSTATVNARTHTGTTGTGGVPIYWLDGPKVADNYADFYDGSWNDKDGATLEDGTSLSSGRKDQFICTGTNDDGTTESQPLGAATCAGTKINISGNTLSGATGASSAASRYLVLSGVFRVGNFTATTPAIESVSVTSDTGSDGEYVKDDAIKVTVTFSEAVAVTGTPKIKMRLSEGATPKRPSYVAAESTATALVFSYTVKAEDYSYGGVIIPRDGIVLSGGATIENQAGTVDADLDHAKKDSLSAHKVHVRPKVTSVTVASTPAADGSYRTGETIQIDLTFDKAVAVFTDFGTPEVWFVMDGSNPARREAAYATTVGDHVVRFEYAVQAGDLDLDGISFMNHAIVWNDGAIVRKEHGDVDDLDTLKIQRAAENGGTTSTFALPGHRVNAAVSTDATLSGLALKDGSTAIELTPSPFVATTTSYTAAVANAVDEITIVPTVNDDTATYEIQNSGGTALVDTDSNADDFQVDLAVGANTIKVQVTAEDGTTDTYTVVVTRAAAATPTVSISADKTSAVFKEDGITYTVTRTGSTTAALSVSVALTQTKNFLATSNLTQTVTIGAGDSTGAFTISAADFQHFATGTKVEGGTLTATVQDVLGYDPGSPSSVDVAIVIGVMIRFDMGAYQVAEGAGTLTVKLIARTGPGAPRPTYDSSFQFSTPQGSALADIDYVDIGGGDNFLSTDFTADGGVWKAEQTYDIAITNDTLDETDETFEFQLHRNIEFESFSFVDASGNSCGDTCKATVTIVDDDAPIPEATIAAGSATEGSPVMFTVTLSTTTTVPVTVPYSTSVESDDTATLSASAPGGADFVNVNNAAITIQAGSMTGTIPISTTDDTVDEPDETFTVTLGTPTNATLGTTTAAKGTIADNDATPTATLALNPTSISEDGGSSTVTATLDRASSEATTITVSAMAVSPAVAADFTLSGSTLTIAAGSTTSTGTVTISANDNSVAGGNKSVTVSATAANDLAVTAPSNKTLTITDDDGASNRVTLTVSPATVAENATGSARTVTVTATLNGSALASDAVVTVSVDADTATEDDDFTAVEDFTVTITGGSTSGSATFDLIPNNDTTDEPDETVKVTGRTTVSGLTVLPSAGVPVTIADNDATPAVTLVLTPASIPEDGGTTTLSTVTATLDHASSEATTIDISAAAGTNTEAGDFTVTTNKRLTIAAGATTSTGTVTVRAVNDGIYTGDKSVTVSGTATNDLNIVQPAAQTLTITEDDTASTEVTLSVSPASIPEGATGNARRVTVTATLNNAARPDATVVNVTVAGVTATAGDFTAVPPFDVTIPAGDSSATAMFTLAPVDDDTDEADETVGVTGTTTAPGLTVGPAVAPTVTIADNDATPTVTLVLAPASIPENGGSSTVTATLNHPSSEDTTVTVSAAAGTNTDPNDFTKSGSTLTIAAGATASTGTVTISATNNTVADGDKSVTVFATAANDLDVTAPANRTLAITDDEVASTGLTLTVSPDSVSESATGNARTVTVTATLNGSAREAGTVVTISVDGNTATAGTDFALVTDFALTIDARSTVGSAEFNLIPLPDTTDEPDETVTVTGAVSGLSVLPAGGATVTLTDDDDTPEVTLVLTPASIPENGGTTTRSTVTATLDHASSETTTVTVSTTPVGAAETGDYAQSGTTLTIAAGATTSTGTVRIRAIDNDVDHPNRQVTVSGAAANDRAIGQPAPVTLTITDEEATSNQVTLTVSPAAISEGATGSARTVTVTVSLNAAARETAATVTLSISGGTADAGDDFTVVQDVVLTIPAGSTSGTAQFTLAPIDDTTDEPNETVRVSGTSATSGITVNQPAGGLTVTINDNDDTPEVTLVLTPSSISEAGGTSTVTATLDHPSSQATTITVSVIPLVDADADDYTQTGTTLTIAAEATTSAGSVTIAANDNQIDHANRQLGISGAAVNGLGVEQPDIAPLEITDNELTSTEVTLTVSPATISEGATSTPARTVTVTGTLDAAAREADANVTLSIIGGTAVAGGDFTAVAPLTLTVPAGSTAGTATFELIPINDTTDEPNETVRVSGVTATAGISVGQPSGGNTVTITDNDDPPTVTLVLSQSSISENRGTSTVTATLDHRSSQATTITLTATAGANTAAADFSVTSNKTLTIAADATTSTGTVTITGVDNEFDDTAAKSVTVSGSASNGLGIVQPTAQTLAINDDEADSTTVLLSVSPSSVSEGATGAARTVTVTAMLNGAARATTVPVTVSVAGNTATAVTDFVAVSDFTITIASGATSQTGTFTLAPENDDIDEPDETLTVSGSTTATGLTVGTASVTLADNDVAPTVTLVLAPASINEDGGSSTVTASLDHPSSEATTVAVSAAPGTGTAAADFTRAGAMLTIAAGATSSTGTVTITANDNDTYTGNKSATVSGTAANDLDIVQPQAQTLTIAEDDTASTTVTLSVSPDTVAEDATGPARTVTVTATLNDAARPDATALTVTVAGVTAGAGTDFSLVPDLTVTIPADTMSAAATFDLAPVDDDTDEPDETVRVSGTTTASGLTVAPAGGLTVTLADNDATPVVTLVLAPTSIGEDGGSSTVTATLDHPSSQATTVAVSAAPVNPAVMGDFTRSGTTLTIAAGGTTSTGTVTIAARDNEIDHPDRTVEVTGLAANNLAITQPSTQTLTITDNEETSRVVQLTVSDLSGTNAIDEGDSATVTVTATLDAAAREDDAVVDVTVVGRTTDGTAAGTAEEGDDFSAVSDFIVTIPAGQTSATAMFTLTTLEDDTSEEVETVRIRGAINFETQGPGLSVAPEDGRTVDIADNDPDPEVTLVLSPSSISENSGVSTVTATLDRPSGNSVTVQISATATSPATAADFNLSASRTVLIAAGRTISQNIGGPVTITGVNDSVVGTHKSVTVSGAAFSSRVVQPEPETLTISDDDTPATGITLTVSPDRVLENAAGSDRTVTVTATLNGAARSTAAEVTVSVAGVTATAGTDFMAVSDFAITIPANLVSGTNTFTLAPVNDETDEPDRTVRVSGTTSASGLTVSPSAGLTVTIADDDPSPQVTLALSATSISESGGVSTVTATLDRPSSGQTTVTVTPAPVPPAVAGDYRLNGSRLTIAAGQTTSTGTVTIAAVNNEIAAADKAVEVSGTAETTGPGVTQPDALTLTITDDEQPSTAVLLSLSPEAISEGARGNAQRVTVTAELNGAARTADTVVAMVVTPGSATQGMDFAEVSGFPVTITAGRRSGSATFTLTPLDDSIDEPDETVRVTGSLSVPGLSLEQPPGGLTLTIEDNEPEPQATLVLMPESIREDGGSAEVTATLDSPSTAATTITVTAAAVAPAVAGDFRLIGTTLTIPIGATESTGTVTIEAIDNEVAAPNKRVAITATTDNAFGVGDPVDRTLTITDNDSPSRAVTLSVSPPEIQEGASRTVTVTAELDGAARPDPTEVVLAVGAGTAARSDFAAVDSFTLTIDAGQKSGTADFTLAPVDDETDEPDETIRVTGRASGLTVAPRTGVEVTIVDDDEAPAVRLVLTPESIREDGGVSRVSAILDHPSSQATTVTISTVPGPSATDRDFKRSGTVLRVPAYTTWSTGSVTVRAVDNDTEEGERTVTVSGAADNQLGVVQPQAATLTVTDDETASTEVILTVSPERVQERPAGQSQRVTVTATLDGAPRASETVVTVSVSDVAVQDFTVTIPAGDTRGTEVFELTAEDDGVDGPDETVTVTGRASGLTVLDATLTITDEQPPTPPRPPRPQPPPTLSLAVVPDQVAEDATEVVQAVTATLHGGTRATDTNVTVSVSGDTATAGDDFLAVPDFTLTIPAGAPSGTGTFTLAPVDDAMDEPDETVRVTGTAPGVEAAPAVIVTIMDNDERGVTVTPAVLAVPPGASGGYALVLTSQPTAPVTIAVMSDRG